MPDEISLARLNELHPKLRENAISAYLEAVKKTPANVHPFINETLRSFKRSDELYAQGRTKPGPIVTNAKAGQSYHNYGLAIDFCLQVKGVVSWRVDENWLKVVEIFKERGWSWGGDFQSLKDYPHLELRFGHHWKELLKLHNDGNVDVNGYVIL